MPRTFHLALAADLGSLLLAAEVDRLLWQLGHRPIKVSKFGTSLSVRYPGLPANRWARARRWPWVEGALPVS